MRERSPPGFRQESAQNNPIVKRRLFDKQIQVVVHRILQIPMGDVGEDLEKETQFLLDSFVWSSQV